MSGTLRARVLHTFLNGVDRDGVSFLGDLPVTSSIYRCGRQTISTTATTINAPDITTGGWCYIENLDAANYLEIRASGGSESEYLIRVDPGEFALFRAATAALPLKLKADTAAVEIWFEIHDA